MECFDYWYSPTRILPSATFSMVESGEIRSLIAAKGEETTEVASNVVFGTISFVVSFGSGGSGHSR